MPKTVIHGLSSELPGTPLFDGTVNRTAIRMDNALVVFNFVKPGMPDPEPHDHPFDQLALIYDGAIEFDIEGTSYVVEPGGYLYIPAGVTHVGRLARDEAALNIDIFAPAREDYLFLTKDQPE
jgi:quercetin dioxygenase-like cupin family protein